MLAVKPSAAFLCALILWIKHHGLRTAVALPVAADWHYADLGENAQNVTFTSSSSNEDHTLYHNLWWHNSRFYGLTDASSNDTIKIDMSYNLELTALPVRDAHRYCNNIKAGWMPGVTLVIDMAFPAYPDNFGHWAEALLPVYNVLAQAEWAESLPDGMEPVLDAVMFVNVVRDQLAGLAWVWEVLQLAVAGAVRPPRALPPVLFYNELDGLPRDAWLGFQAALLATDRYTRGDGRGGFASGELGRHFRAAAYSAAGLPLPAAAPRTITLLTAVDGEEVTNGAELAEALQDVGRNLGLKVRPYTVTPRAPLASYVAAMARTGVLVARHGPLLANAAFLAPGAVVLELLPYNWEWKGISQLYFNITRSLGDVHHFAWRAGSPRWAIFSEGEERYASWTAQECNSRECLDVNARAGMVADVATIRELLYEVLPPVLRGGSGATVAAHARAWPTLEQPSGGTPLWWDKV